MPKNKDGITTDGIYIGVDVDAKPMLLDIFSQARYPCANCGAMQEEKYMGYSSLFHGWLCSACKPKDGDTDVPIRVSREAHKWLLKNRGAGPVKKLIDKVIMKYQEGDTA